MQTRDEIKQINRALQCACESNALNLAELQIISKTIVKANWNTVVGNSIDYTYDVNNNVTIAEYFEGATLVFTQTFTYDANNNCTNITTT
jgi:hypothetical protein